MQFAYEKAKLFVPQHHCCRGYGASHTTNFGKHLQLKSACKKNMSKYRSEWQTDFEWINEYKANCAVHLFTVAQGGLFDLKQHFLQSGTEIFIYLFFSSSVVFCFFQAYHRVYTERPKIVHFSGINKMIHKNSTECGKHNVSLGGEPTDPGPPDLCPPGIGLLELCLIFPH